MDQARSFSLKWFLIGTGTGFVAGALALGLVVTYLLANAFSGGPTKEVLFGDAIEQVREGIAQTKQEGELTVAYGQVISNSPGVLVLEVTRTTGKKQLTFIYDSETEFIELAHDAASTPLPLSSDAIAAGDGLQVFCNEPIGSVENQHAVKVIKY